MKTIKNVGIWVAYWLIAIIKFPFAIVEAISGCVEALLICVITKVAKFSDSNFLKECVSNALLINSGSCIDLSDMYDDFANELE